MNDIKISYLIPTGRKFNEYGAKTFASILKYANKYKYEILVCGKEKINHPNLVYIAEPEHNIGAVKPINKMFEYANGEYVIVLNDDFIINKSTELSIEFYNTVNNSILGLCPKSYLTHGINLNLLCFPVLTKTFVNEKLNGKIFNEKFNHYGSDEDLVNRIKLLGMTITITDKYQIDSKNFQEPSIVKQNP